MKAYYFVRSEQADEIAECGLKLSAGEHRPADVCRNSKEGCFVAKLHPADYTENQGEKTCLKIDLTGINAYVAEGFYSTPECDEKMDAWYNASVIPAKEYQLGMYRNPECLLVNTVLPDCITLCDPLMDEPILYPSSEDLYLDRLFETAQTECDDFRELALLAYYDWLAASGHCRAEQVGCRKIYKEETGNNNIVLTDRHKTEL